MSDTHDPARELTELKREFPFFVGIDSDGCVFDSMEIKHKECFIPNIIKYWNLQPVSKFARETAEFVNLYSSHRGINRWPGLVLVMDLLRERPEVIARECNIPMLDTLRAFSQSGKPMSNNGLMAYAAEAGENAEIARGLEWSNAVNAFVSDIVFGLPPFPFVRESLELVKVSADAGVVSATPGEALRREWDEHEITPYVRAIAGQEFGNKTRQLQLATSDRYAPEHVLMIGDSPGDLKAARANSSLFYPINPGLEDSSWRRFHDEAYPRFLEGKYAGNYEAALIKEFEALLPETPPWNR
jgi:phosphoglycolate phosphatase-like HAD superfamily hydrolase